MERFEFQSEEEKKIYRQLLGTKEALREAYEQRDMFIVQDQFEKLDKMMGTLDKTYSLATYDLEEPSRIKRIFGRVTAKLLKLFFMGPFAKKQIAYNKQVLTILKDMRQMQEGMMEVLIRIREEQEEDR